MDLNEVPTAPFQRHPWEIARADFFQRVLADGGLPADRPLAVLDVGAGDGFLARQVLAALPAGSRMVCLDAQYTDTDLVRFTSPAVEGLSFVRSVSPGARFDLLMLLDVIEHVPDDVEFLRGFVAGSLADAGRVLVSVPAWQALFSRHDEALEHYRRYSPAAIERVIAAAGLEVRRGGGLFHSLLLPRIVTVLGEQLARRLGRGAGPPPHLGMWRGGPALSSAVGAALAADNALSRVAARAGVPLPGLSTWALCERAPEARSDVATGAGAGPPRATVGPSAAVTGSGPA